MLDIDKEIAGYLSASGEFSASDLEGRLDISRSSVNKNLRRLTDDGVLIMSSGTGPTVRYRLGRGEKALVFLFAGRDGLMIDDLSRAWGIGRQAAKVNVKRYVDSGLLLKYGLPPKKIVYSLAEIPETGLSSEQKQVLEKYYAYVTPDGRLLKGVRGFFYWFKNRSGRQDIESLAQEYLDTRRQYYKGQDKVFLIDATSKIRQIFGSDSQLSGLFHRDFDSLPVFGKTYLSRMIGIAKAGRNNAAAMQYIVDNIKDSVEKVIADQHIEAVAFIPPTVSRKVQLLDFIAKRLKLGLPVIKLEKKIGLAPVQQKSLKKIEDRILNAKNTIEIASAGRYGNVLLIDDVTGSGATLNETARKLLAQGSAKKVFAFTVTGSAKANDFEVISEA